MVTVSEQVADGNGYSALAVELARLRAENARLLRLLKLTRQEAAPPGPWQSGLFEAPPGLVHADSPPEAKVALFGALFAARTDVYAVRWENTRSGKAGWLPAVRGGWRKGVPHADRDYLPLTTAVLASHLSGDQHIGFYPLLNGDRCWWLAADFDGPAAMLDALAYLKAARSMRVPAALEVSRSGVGAHAWVFFTGPVPAEVARRLGTGLLREAMALRGQMDLASYDRLFPSQDVLPAGGVGNLIAAPLYGRSRRDGATTLPRPGHPRAARGSMGVPVHAGPDEPARSGPGGGQGRTGHGRGGSQPDRRTGLYPDQASPTAGHPRPSRVQHPGRTERANTSFACHAEACSVDAQPTVL